MIRVPQSEVDVPHVLTAAAVAAERNAAIAHYGADPPAGSFEFKLYRDRAVKEALVRLFRGKCAYCETPYAAAHPVDVEHWRPKGDVEEEDGTRAGKGYYWLAAEWTNLLPSCIDCNRRRSHLIAGRPRALVVGKGNAFPLQPGSQRTLTPGAEAAELPLLLNPYDPRIDPGEVLEWNVDEAVVVARPDSNGQPDPRGVESIRVYALNRTELVQARREVLHLMRQHMYVITRLSELLALQPPVPDGVREIVLDLVQHESRALKEFAHPCRAYSSFANAVIRDFETRQLQLT